MFAVKLDETAVCPAENSHLFLECVLFPLVKTCSAIFAPLTYKIRIQRQRREPAFGNALTVNVC